MKVKQVFNCISLELSDCQFSVMVFSILSLAAAAATLASLAACQATSGDFNILSFNVAGLPAILNSNDVPGDKATNAGTIGTLFAEYDYDVIHVQKVSSSLRCCLDSSPTLFL